VSGRVGPPARTTSPGPALRPFLVPDWPIGLVSGQELRARSEHESRSKIKENHHKIQRLSPPHTNSSHTHNPSTATAGAGGAAPGRGSGGVAAPGEGCAMGGVGGGEAEKFGTPSPAEASTAAKHQLGATLSRGSNGGSGGNRPLRP
jgi:hypothetical protein